MLDETYYTPEELAKRFKLSVSTIYNLIDKGDIPSIKLGKCYRIPQKELEKYLRQEKGQLPKSIQKFVNLIESLPVKKDVVDIILYGSYARGDFNEESDIDILIILKKLDAKLRDDIAGASDEAMSSSGYDDFLSVIQMSQEQWNRAGEICTPFYNSVVREGISLWKKQ